MILAPFDEAHSGSCRLSSPALRSSWQFHLQYHWLGQGAHSANSKDWLSIRSLTILIPSVFVRQSEVPTQS